MRKFLLRDSVQRFVNFRMETNVPNKSSPSYTSIGSDAARML